MICQNCQKRVASVHFTQIINDQKSEIYLCDVCASQKGYFKFSVPFGINSLFSGLMSSVFMGNESANGLQNICNVCGMSYDEFQRSGKLGCSNCYNVFEPKLGQLIKRVHGATEHTGRVPIRLKKVLESEKEINKLKEQLTEAVKREEYEKAAELRDKIRSLEGK